MTQEPTTEGRDPAPRGSSEVTGHYDKHSALIVVDVQNDFADPTGGLYVQDGESVINGVNAQVVAAQNGGATVVYTQDWHPGTTPHFQKDGGIWPVHCVAGTWGARLHPELLVHGPVVRKGTSGEDGYSGFSVRDPVTGEGAPTQLHALLPPDVERVVIVGLAGDYCVKETALDARRLGYSVQTPLALTRFVNLQPRDDQRTIEDLREAGVTVS